MDINTQINQLIASGELSEERASLWNAASGLLAALDAACHAGACAVVKIDGERTKDQRYTVVLSGRTFGDDFFRKDGGEVSELLSEALNFYQSKRK